MPTPAQLKAELAALLAADPSGTGMVQAPPGPSTPSWDAWSAANPVPLAYTGMPPGQDQAAVTAPPPPPPPSQLPVDPNNAPMPAGPMPTYSQQQDQAAMPPGPVAPVDPRRAALAQMLAQQQPGPMDPAAMGGPRVAPAFPLPGRKPPAPTRMAAARRPAKPQQVARISESDRLNAESVANIIRRRLAKAQA